MEKRQLLLGGLALGLLLILGLSVVLLWPDQPAVRRLTGRAGVSTAQSSAAPACAIGELAGDWLLFIHYDDRTVMAELALDRQGHVIRSSRPIAAGLNFAFGPDGSLNLTNQKLRLKGRYDPDEGYVSGTAVGGWPVPFSARRLTEKK